MPGVIVTTSTRSGPAGVSDDEQSTYFVVGQTERGPLDHPVLVRSLTDFVATFGARVSYGTLYDDVRTHFEEGGVQVVVQRIAGTTPTVGLLTLKDRSAGAGLNTLRVDAVNAGSWSSQAAVQVLDGTVADTFTLAIVYQGSLVETWRDLTSPADAAARLAFSQYVRATDLSSVTVAPANNPRVLASTALSAGTDDRGTIVAGNYIAGLALLTPTTSDVVGNVYDTATGVVAIPGQPSSAVGVALASHARDNTRIAYTSVVPGSTDNDASNAATALIAALALAGVPGEYIGLVYPAIRIPDAGQVVRTVTSEGYKAAARARSIAGNFALGIAPDGPWRAAAGEWTKAQFVIGVDQQLNKLRGDTLNNAHVSVIRPIARGLRWYGDRSMSIDPDNYRLLKDRDTLNFLVVKSERILEQYVFETIDGNGRLLGRVNGELVGELKPIADAGGLFPRDGDPGYSVDTGPSVNTILTLSQNEIRAVVGVRISPTAETIRLSIVKVAVTANV